MSEEHPQCPHLSMGHRQPRHVSAPAPLPLLSASNCQGCEVTRILLDSVLTLLLNWRHHVYPA